MVQEVTLHQLLDLAIGHPEVGVVNLNLLHSVIFMIIRRLEAVAPEEALVWDGDLGGLRFDRSSSVEGSDSTVEPKMSAKEYLMKRDADTGKKISDPSRTFHRSDDGSGALDQRISRITSGPSGVSGTPHEHRVSRSLEGPETGTVVMTRQSWINIQLQMKKLQDRVETLKRQVAPDELVEHLKQFFPEEEDQHVSLADMMQRLQLSKRIDNNEAIVFELSKLIQKANQEIQDLKSSAWGQDIAELKSENERQKKESEESLTKMEVHHGQLKTIITKIEEIEKRIMSQEDLTRSQQLGSMGSEDTLAALQKQFSRMEEQLADIVDIMDTKLDKELFTDLSGIPETLVEQISAVKKAVTFIRSFREQVAVQHDTLQQLMNCLTENGIDVSEVQRSNLERSLEAEEKVKAMALEVTTKSTAAYPEPQPTVVEVVPDKKAVSESSGLLAAQASRSGSDSDSGSVEMSQFEKRIDDLEKQVHDFIRKVDRMTSSSVQKSPSVEDAGQLDDAKMKILELFEAMETLSEQVHQLGDENMEKQKQIEKVLESVQLIKDSKAEQEEVSLLKEEKADKMMVEDKVDQKLFETSLNEINTEMMALEDKITYVDEMNQSMFGNINDALMRKVDRSEVGPLKDYINSKVKMLLIKIKKLQTSTGPEDGASTRKQLLKRFHCLSCDKPVVAAGVGWPVPQAPTQVFPAHQTTRPITTYEIEMIRQQRKLNLSRKAFFESSPTEKDRNKRIERAREASSAKGAHMIGTIGPFRDAVSQAYRELPENIDTRYCGGSHTMTFPFNRVSRQGQLVDDLPALRQEVQLRGVDGTLYRGVMPPDLAKSDEAPEQQKTDAIGIQGSSMIGSTTDDNLNPSTVAPATSDSEAEKKTRKPSNSSSLRVTGSTPNNNSNNKLTPRTPSGTIQVKFTSSGTAISKSSSATSLKRSSSQTQSGKKKDEP